MQYTRAPRAHPRPPLVAALALAVLALLAAPAEAARASARKAVAMASAGWHGRPVQDPQPRPQLARVHRSAGWTAGSVALGTGYARPSGSRRVRDVQRRLRRLGYRPGPIDGRFGPRTQAAIRWFQLKHGLTSSGGVNRHTLAVLHARGDHAPLRTTRPAGTVGRPEVHPRASRAPHGRVRLARGAPPEGSGVPVPIFVVSALVALALRALVGLAVRALVALALRLRRPASRIRRLSADARSSDGAMVSIRPCVSADAATALAAPAPTRAVSPGAQRRASSPTEPADRRHPSLPALMLAVLLALALVAPPARAAAGDVGFQDAPYRGTGGPTGTKRAQSALWFNDGWWWASMWSSGSGAFDIFRLNAATQAWSDTGVAIDTRAGTSADTLSDGAHLYVASHHQSNTAASGQPSLLYRYSYEPALDRYALDSGFPVQINAVSSETLVIATDSTGKLWATWMQSNRIYINRTLGDDHTWGRPFALTLTGAGVSSDDISAVVAFGNHIGVMWGNQNSGKDGFYFAAHDDGQPDTTWRPSQLAWGGAGVADDHINLKVDAAGRVYAAIKTSFTARSAPLTVLLVRDPSTGRWSRHTVDTVADCPNRPTVVVDQWTRIVHVFETAPAAPAFACTSMGGNVYEKTAPLDSMSFPRGRGTAVLRDADSHEMHNNTSTKQTVSPTTGLVVLAVERQTGVYWHHYDALGGPPPIPPAAEGTPPTPSPSPTTPSASPTTTTTPHPGARGRSSGTARRCTVPNLRRHTLHGARRLLARAHCKLGHVRGQRHRAVVIAQRPAAGTRTRDGTRVRLRLARRHPR